MFRVYIREHHRPYVLDSDILECVKVEIVYSDLNRMDLIRCHCAAGNILEYYGPFEIVEVEEVDHAKTDN